MRRRDRSVNGRSTPLFRDSEGGGALIRTARGGFNLRLPSNEPEGTRGFTQSLNHGHTMVDRRGGGTEQTVPGFEPRTLSAFDPLFQIDPDETQLLCLDEDSKRRCLVYAFGFHGNWSFENAMAARGCEVRTGSNLLPGLGRPIRGADLAVWCRFGERLPRFLSSRDAKATNFPGDES